MGYWINRACSPNDNTSFCFNKHYTDRFAAEQDWTSHGYALYQADIVFIDDSVSVTIYTVGNGHVLSNGALVNPVVVTSGTSVTFQAVPDPGWVFQKFVSATGVESFQNPVSFPIVSSGTLTAVFVQSAPANVTVLMSTYGSGRISANGVVASSITIPAGTQVTFNAIPDAGNAFQKFVSANGTESFSNPVTFTVTQDGSITAYFVNTSTPATVALNVGSGGNVNVSKNGVFLETVYANEQHLINFILGDDFSFEAIPNTGFRFSKWTNPNGTEATINPLTGHIINTTGTLNAIFIADPVTVTVLMNTDGNGRILVNGIESGSYTLQAGHTATFSAIPNAGYRFEKFVSDTGAVSTSNPFTVTVTANGSITAYFVVETTPPPVTTTSPLLYVGAALLGYIALKKKG